MSPRRTEGPSLKWGWSRSASTWRVRVRSTSARCVEAMERRGSPSESVRRTARAARRSSRLNERSMASALASGHRERMALPSSPRRWIRVTTNARWHPSIRDASCSGSSVLNGRSTSCSAITSALSSPRTVRTGSGANLFPPRTPAQRWTLYVATRSVRPMSGGCSALGGDESAARYGEGRWERRGMRCNTTVPGCGSRA